MSRKVCYFTTELQNKKNTPKLSHKWIRSCFDGHNIKRKFFSLLLVQNVTHWFQFQSWIEPYFIQIDFVNWILIQNRRPLDAWVLRTDINSVSKSYPVFITLDTAMYNSLHTRLLPVHGTSWCQPDTHPPGWVKASESLFIANAAYQLLRKLSWVSSHPTLFC